MNHQPIILITGCSSGIGRACAEGMARRGWRVIASARRNEDVRALQDAGFESVLIDLASSHSVIEGAAKVLGMTQGRINAVFLNAGYGQAGAVEDLSRPALREQFETNVFGTIELANQLIPAMRRAKRGRIVINTSVLGFVALRYRGAYNASKYALEGFADTLRLELHGTGIEVSLIEPGPILSRFRANSLKAFHRHVRAESSPHREVYQQQLARLNTEGSAVPLTLGPEAVMPKLVHACEAHRPRIRYPVTVPSHLFAWLKRILPASWLDRILLTIG